MAKIETKDLATKSTPLTTLPGGWGGGAEKNRRSGGGAEKNKVVEILHVHM